MQTNLLYSNEAAFVMIEEARALFGNIPNPTARFETPNGDVFDVPLADVPGLDVWAALIGATIADYGYKPLDYLIKLLLVPKAYLVDILLVRQVLGATNPTSIESVGEAYGLFWKLEYSDAAVGSGGVMVLLAGILYALKNHNALLVTALSESNPDSDAPRLTIEIMFNHPTVHFWEDTISPMDVTLLIDSAGNE